ncbi:GTPase [Catellatospora sp. TT07R-123]|uniref:dynamin family protein n=1 Tax=Catellatospora sp. TT07R-123 TaxID=2733863 RepID=UPI001B21FA0D|nr:dynamin family protein [Catellatospora sp. TT07R-123]GHJ47132.1 GTPase [Catellatospora sp. TT07R-123]
MTARTSGPLCAQLAEILAAARPALPPGRFAAAVGAVADRLADTRLRIAVGGRVKAGKSTLINALVGQKVAATAAVECTMVVAWFRHSHQNRIEVRHVDGRVTTVASRPGGGVPDEFGELGVPREQVRELVVHVVNERLDTDYTIIDTPGMDSLSGLDDVAMAALAEADALIYVMPHPGEGDVAALEALRRKANGALTAANVLGVLSRIDLLGDGISDPWPLATQLATTYSAKLRGLIATTVPVAGLLAQTAVGDGFGEADAQLVARLADADPADLAEALRSARNLREWHSCPIGADERERLSRLLSRYGIRCAVAAARRGVSGAQPLLDELRRSSGVDELNRLVFSTLVASADRLRASSALARIDLAGAAATTEAERDVYEALRARLAEVRRHPRMRQAELTTALVDLATHRLSLEAADEQALVRLATGADDRECLGLAADADPGALVAAADAQVRRWRRLEGSPLRVVARHARTAREVCETIYFHSATGSGA